MKCKHIRDERMDPFATVTLQNVPDKRGPDYHQSALEVTVCAFCTGTLRAWLPQILRQLGGELQ